MARTDDAVWVVGVSDNLGTLEEDLTATDAIIEETWPGGRSGTVVALVRSERAQVDAVVEALGADAEVFDTEDGGRSAATKEAASPGGGR